MIEVTNIDNEVQKCKKNNQKKGICLNFSVFWGFWLLKCLICRCILDNTYSFFSNWDRKVFSDGDSSNSRIVFVACERSPFSSDFSQMLLISMMVRAIAPSKEKMGTTGRLAIPDDCKYITPAIIIASRMVSASNVLKYRAILSTVWRNAREVRGMLFIRALCSPLQRSAMMANNTPEYSMMINRRTVADIVC